MEPDSAVGTSELDEPELECTVSDPVQQGDGVQAFVSYRVSTKTTLPHFRWKQCSVIRRFRDFSLLHQRLSDKNPGIIVPTLPEKNVASKLVHNPDFVAARCAALNAFTAKICSHPTLSYCSDLHIFLEATEDAWAEYSSKPADGLPLAKQKDALSTLKEWQRSASNLLSGKVDTNDPEYNKLKAYFSKLEVILADLSAQSARLIRRQSKLAHALYEFGESLGAIGNAMSPTGPEVQARSSLLALARSAAVLSSKMAERAKGLSADFDAPFRELVRSILAVQATLADRQAAYVCFISLKDELEARKARLQKGQAGGKLTGEQVLAEEREIAGVRGKMETAKEQYHVIIERMQVEVGRFDKDRALEFARLCRVMAEGQRAVAEDTAQAWGILGSPGGGAAAAAAGAGQQDDGEGQPRGGGGGVVPFGEGGDGQEGDQQGGAAAGSAAGGGAA